MKRILIVVGLAIIGIIIYFLTLGGPSPSTVGRRVDSTRSTTPSPTPTPATTPTPSPTPVLTPVPTPVPTPIVTPMMTPPPRTIAPPPTPIRTAPPAGGGVNDRSAQIRRIIYNCARRAGWEILGYRQPRYGTSEVTGWSPLGDHVRGIRFLDEVQNSGIIMDIDGGRTGRPGKNRQGRDGTIATITIRWR